MAEATHDLLRREQWVGYITDSYSVWTDIHGVPQFALEALNLYGGRLGEGQYSCIPNTNLKLWVTFETMLSLCSN